MADKNETSFLDRVAFTYERPTYNQLLLRVDRESGDSKTLQEHFGYMFSGGVLPEEGDQVAWVCTKRTDDELAIDLKVIKKYD